MKNKDYVSLRERALHAWQEERPRRIAQLRRRITLALELRKKLEKLLGRDLSINVITDLQDRPVAIVEEFRFTFIEYHGGKEKNIALIDICPRCEAEIGFTIKDLADLGQLIESFDTSKNLGCTECIGLADAELEPRTIKTV